MLYTMKQVCEETKLPYETLKFYCNKGLVPNVKRDVHNHRVFDEYDLAWIKDLNCLKRCGLTLSEMKEYLDLCLEGQQSIEQRRIILAQKKNELIQQLAEIKKSIRYIETKDEFYQQVLDHKIPYRSNLINTTQQKGRVQ